MNTSNIKHTRVAGILALAAAASILVAGCATAPQSPPGSASVREKLSALQSNSELANKVPVELREAAAAVMVAEKPVGEDIALGEHRVYMADRMVDIAMARAERRYAEDQLAWRPAPARQTGHIAWPPWRRARPKLSAHWR